MGWKEKCIFSDWIYTISLSFSLSLLHTLNIEVTFYFCYAFDVPRLDLKCECVRMPLMLMCFFIYNIFCDWCFNSSHSLIFFGSFQVDFLQQKNICAPIIDNVQRRPQPGYKNSPKKYLLRVFFFGKSGTEKIFFRAPALLEQEEEKNIKSLGPELERVESVSAWLFIFVFRCIQLVHHRFFLLLSAVCEQYKELNITEQKRILLKYTQRQQRK